MVRVEVVRLLVQEGFGRWTSRPAFADGGVAETQFDAVL